MTIRITNSHRHQKLKEREQIAAGAYVPFRKEPQGVPRAHLQIYSQMSAVSLYSAGAEYLTDNPIPSFSQYLMTEYLAQRINFIKEADAQRSAEPIMEEVPSTYTPSRKRSREDDDDKDSEQSSAPETKRARKESN